jgi:hypothetical protein
MFRGFVAGILLAFNRKNFTASEKVYMDFSLED